MPVNYYAGWSEADLLAELRTAQNRQGRGNVVEVQASGVRTRKEFPLQAGVTVNELIKRIRWSLYVLAVASNDAAKITLYPNPYAEQVRTTAARYS